MSAISILKKPARFVSVLLTSMALAGGWASASDLYGPDAEQPVIGGSLTMGLTVEPPNLDPFHQAADARVKLSVLLYQGLFYETADGDAVPLLAKSYEVSEDGLNYTIQLREGVKFHTGAVMTANDVVYSYNYLRDPNNGSPGAGDYGVIKSVEAIGDNAVRFTLSSPNASLPMALGNKYGGVVPAGYFDAADAKDRLNRESVGTGPFKIKEFQPNSNIVFVRNEDYWEAGVPYLDEINFAILPSSASTLVALKNHRINLVVLDRPQDADQIEASSGLTVERWPSLNQKVLDIGTEVAPLGDARVRAAIALAIDKDEIMRASVRGYGSVVGTTVAAMQEKWGVPIDELAHQKVDLDASRKLLAEAGYPDGFPLTLTTINNHDWMGPAAVTLKEQLARVGIDVGIRSVDIGVWINNFRQKTMGFTFNDWATQPDPNLLYYRHFHTMPEGEDFRNWNNAEASALLDQGRAESDFVKRREIYGKFQKLLAEQAVSIMLFSADHVTVKTENTRNYKQHPTGWYYGLAKTYLNN